MNASRHPIWLALLVWPLGCQLLRRAESNPRPPRAVEPAAPADFERGPHNGRLLRDGDLSLEVTIFEDGVPPEFHVYPYRNNQPLDPRQVQLGMSVSRLGGEVNHFAFQPQQDYLRADARGATSRTPSTSRSPRRSTARSTPGPMRAMRAARRSRRRPPTPRA